MLAIIGGSGLTQLSNMEIERREVARTPYGEPSGALVPQRLVATHKTESSDAATSPETPRSGLTP